MEPSRSSWQASKSELTRTAVLNAAIECLAQLPYAEVTISAVADRAGISKGGIQYHFKSRDELLQQAIDHLFDRRLEAYRRDLSAVPVGMEITDHVIETHWKHLTEPDFKAYQELVLVSRTNRELRELVVGRYREFFREWLKLSEASFDWDLSNSEVVRLGNVAHHLMDGMAYNWFADQLRPRDIKPLLDYAKSLLREAVSISRGATTAARGRRKLKR